MNSVRWGMVAFCVAVSCGVLGHYLDGYAAFMSVLGMASLGSIAGGAAIGADNG